jgi:hypothetical protein
VFSEMWRNWHGEESCHGYPVTDELNVHADVRRDFAVPITCSLEFVETVFESVLVAGAKREMRQRT